MTALFVILAGLSACDRDPSPASAGGYKAAPETPPREVIGELIARRDRAAYQELDELIVPERGRHVVALLMAVDGFLHANDALREYVQRKFAVGLSQAIDQSHWSGRLGVFSAHVELIDERINGDEAVVSFMSDGRLPIRRAQLRLLEGRWRYDPGAGYDQRMTEAFNEMARGMRQVLNDLKNGRPAAADIQTDPELLVEEVRVRLSKGLGLLPAPPATQPASDAVSPQSAEQP